MREVSLYLSFLAAGAEATCPDVFHKREDPGAFNVRAFRALADSTFAFIFATAAATVSYLLAAILAASSAAAGSSASMVRWLGAAFSATTAASSSDASGAGGRGGSWQ